MSTRLLRPDRSVDRSFPYMDLSAAIDQLPEAYATALRLQEAGCDDEVIADRLGLDEEAVGPLLRVAAAKLRALLAAGTEEA
jgi:DNA-directed RNA polymerase specialized sigma24 family protein